jgi:HD-GYP domain-containing protein (c-di-GMP phosphodiesterase class II)
MAIIDAYDAMINDRPYRKAHSKKYAINELINCSGKQFDPDLVGKFIEIISEKEKERENQSGTSQKILISTSK